MKKRNKAVFSVILSVILLFNSIFFISPETARAATYGVVKSGTTSLYFRESPGGTPIKDVNGTTIMLNGGQELTILDNNNSEWYKVSLVYNGNQYTGYVSARYVTITQTDASQSAAPEGNVPASDFEASLTNQGFPESYKVLLRQIHEKHPSWEFKAVLTGIDWNTLVSKEVNKTGQIKNLVYGSSSYPNYNWRSTGVGYNHATDKWSPYDGTTWFAASDELVTYYLDPRTYMYENYIFVFESLSYQQGVHNEIGVEAILKGTFMYQAVPKGETKTYAQLIMEAAEESGVSPYHIASRMKLEMGSTAGVAANGSSSKYPGIYNFFNIGAYDTANGSPVEKGLYWASLSGSYGRPWNSPSKAIKGGAKFLGASYISVGQNTLYTQKFNVTNKNCLFSHQYMTNVQAPATECLANYNAYKSNNLLDSTMVFEIPVYNNMPESAVSKPANSGNPNNWLKSLAVGGYALTPSFSINMTTNYSLIVDQSVTSIDVSASTVNSNARVQGTGRINLEPGTNTIYINVTAQSGAVRTYTLTVVRGQASSGNNVIGGGSSSENQGSVSGRGDMNNDGKISVLDIIKLQRIIVGLDANTPESLSKGDINGDGKISVLDIIKIQRHIVGLEIISQ